MSVEDLNKLGVCELLPRLARREITVQAVAQSCLARIAEREPSVRAFAYLDASAVLKQAQALDAAAERGPLHGLPIAVKDIIDTHDAPTEYGSPIYLGHRPAADAPIVTIARRLGTLIVGKTVTTELATFPPGPTANPCTLAHTPGGSSSGSAAAVADCMVPFAFGTQTTGSIIRPAAFCGVVGYKPSFGMLPRIGVKAISESLDTVGGFARSVTDVALVAAALSGRALQVTATDRAPRLALCRTAQWPHAQAETQALWERESGRLARAGARLVAVELPREFDALADAQNTIWEYEMARCLADEYERNSARIREPLRSQLRAGWAVDVQRYDQAMALAQSCRGKLAELLHEVDALVVPSAPGTAPAGLAATGDPVFNRMWSLLHGPAVHVPTATGASNLPLGLQLVGAPGADAQVLAAAHWVQGQLPLLAL